MTKLGRIQARIASAVARARALGNSLVARGDWGVEYDKKAGWVPQQFGTAEVCICGAIALAENPTDGKGILRAIAKKYRITVAQAASLSDGFEGFPVGETTEGDAFPKHYTVDKTWYRIGRKWRDRADRVE